MSHSWLSPSGHVACCMGTFAMPVGMGCADPEPPGDPRRPRRVHQHQVPASHVSKLHRQEVNASRVHAGTLTATADRRSTAWTPSAASFGLLSSVRDCVCDRRQAWRARLPISLHPRRGALPSGPAPPPHWHARHVCLHHQHPFRRPSVPPYCSTLLRALLWEPLTAPAAFPRCLPRRSLLQLRSLHQRVASAATPPPPSLHSSTPASRAHTRRACRLRL